jgi:hypothetical protein
MLTVAGRSLLLSIPLLTVPVGHCRPLCLHVCSAVSTIIANAHLPFLANLFDATGLAGIFFQGIYTDLTPNWYKVVGRSLLISQFVGATLRMVYLVMR